MIMRKESEEEEGESEGGAGEEEEEKKEREKRRREGYDEHHGLSRPRPLSYIACPTKREGTRYALSSSARRDTLCTQPHIACTSPMAMRGIPAGRA